MNVDPKYLIEKSLTKYKETIDKQSKQMTKKYKILRNVTSDGQNIQNDLQQYVHICKTIDKT